MKIVKLIIKLLVCLIGGALGIYLTYYAVDFLAFYLHNPV